jgi:hypothetical protein
MKKLINWTGLLTVCLLFGLNFQSVQAQIYPQQFVATTPPMGWNSWNYFGSSVSEEVIKKTADGIF